MSLDAQILGPLFELSRDAVIGVGDNQKILFANPAAQALLAAHPGDSAGDILPAPVLDDPAEHFVSTARLRGFTFHITAVRSGGVSLFTLSPRADGREPAVPIQDRALKELGSDLLSARLAMDAIINGTDAEADNKLRVYSAVLYRSYYRIKRLHEHMVLASALLQGSLPFSPRLTELNVLFRDLCATVAALVRPMGIEVTFESTESECRAEADGHLLETLLLNLLTNSLLHAAEGDTIRVSLTRRESRFILAVDDPGHGIAPARLAELFAGVPQTDMTDAAAGAGLGLLIVRGIAELHGGSLILESREEAGTRTRVWLPRPGPEDLQKLRQPDAAYRADGLNVVLTELSVVLDKSFYNRKAFD